MKIKTQDMQLLDFQCMGEMLNDRGLSWHLEGRGNGNVDIVIPVECDKEVSEDIMKKIWMK